MATKNRKHTVFLGERYGLWTVAGREKKHPKHGYIVRCKCLCGTERDVVVRTLTTGKSQSCGCLVVHTSPQGQFELRIHWTRIPSWFNDWNSYEQFYLWALRTGFKCGAELERHKVTKAYGPDNCYWTPRRRPRSPWPRKI